MDPGRFAPPGPAGARRGHFFMGRNRPATLQHPWLSLLGDFQLYADL
ncbi:Mpo1-like protein [Hymenobacter caeli]|uniref:Uncharacterized protein n=1 Tax=Hymenobacter caeli TaxID=2735894 RepID=A0ABX2FMS6_9BACT|nr:Mpo1-like protein [Hymenobacter caeli]NRT18449.1 hypothetical protein [Hymenobacter caeli]